MAGEATPTHDGAALSHPCEFLTVTARPLIALLAVLLACVAAESAEETRTFSFRYAATIKLAQAGVGPVDVWIPLPARDRVQQVLEEAIEASIPGAIESEARYGNRFWHGQLALSDGAPITVILETTVRRSVRRGGVSGIADDGALDPRFLAANERVVVDHPILAPIREEIGAMANGGGTAAKARSIYDWVVDNVEYKKVGSGWGNGDTFWACNERYGNCTDFHSLFISLARSEKIPARFEMGFPVPEDRSEGTIGGYHCWVEFHLRETGWFPIDASEASKHPERRDLFYGTQPADRILFSTGRDLKLGPDHRDRPLNFFIYPYVEVGGRAWTGEIEKAFSFRDE